MSRPNDSINFKTLVRTCIDCIWNAAVLESKQSIYFSYWSNVSTGAKSASQLRDLWTLSQLLSFTNCPFLYSYIVWQIQRYSPRSSRKCITKWPSKCQSHAAKISNYFFVAYFFPKEIVHMNTMPLSLIIQPEPQTINNILFDWSCFHCLSKTNKYSWLSVNTSRASKHCLVYIFQL